MRERFLDRVLNFMGIQEDDEQAAADEMLEESTGGQESVRRRGRLLSFPAKESGMQDEDPGSRSQIAAVPAGGRMRMSIMEPLAFEDVQSICDRLKARRPVIVSVEGLDKDLSRRIIDFVSGTTYAIDGTIQRVGEGIFVFAPSSVTLDVDLKREWEEEI